jgi:uroporphyrinogen-III decarboxylase
VNFLPRGELFIGNDFLDHHFPDQKGEPVRQLQEAARSLGLFLVGIELNAEKSRSLLSHNVYRPLEEYFLSGYINGPVSRLIEKYGFKKAMLSMKKDPSLFSDIATALIEEITEKATLARTNGFSALVVADDIAGKNGLLFSLSSFTETILPVYARLAAVIKKAGLYAFMHSDGDMRNAIDLIANAGYDCIHPVDAQSGLDIVALHAQFGRKITFMGHIDILGWDKTRIQKEIVLAEQGFKSGGLILGSTGGLSADIPEDKLALLYPSWKQTGQ